MDEVLPVPMEAPSHHREPPSGLDLQVSPPHPPVFPVSQEPGSLLGLHHMCYLAAHPLEAPGTSPGQGASMARGSSCFGHWPGAACSAMAVPVAADNRGAGNTQGTGNTWGRWCGLQWGSPTGWLSPAVCARAPSGTPRCVGGLVQDWGVPSGIAGGAGASRGRAMPRVQGM